MILEVCKAVKTHKISSVSVRLKKNSYNRLYFFDIKEYLSNLRLQDSKKLFPVIGCNPRSVKCKTNYIQSYSKMLILSVTFNHITIYILSIPIKYVISKNLPRILAKCTTQVTQLFVLYCMTCDHRVMWSGRISSENKKSWK